MAKQLNLDEMREILTNNKYPFAADYAGILHGIWCLLKRDTGLNATIDEMLGEMVEIDRLDALLYQKVVESVGSLMAVDIAAMAGCQTHFATFQPGFGGTCAPFWPENDGTPVPLILAEYDTGGDWEPEDPETFTIAPA